MNKDYISSSGSSENVNETISRFITNGTMILMYTDKFICCELGEITDTAHLLEARVFNEDKEIKLMRPTIADEFCYRVIDDTILSKEDYMEEDHYLDIDSEQSEGNTYFTTGGGSYTLPLTDAEKIRIRNYRSLDKECIAQITDFRVVRFLKKGEK